MGDKDVNGLISLKTTVRRRKFLFLSVVNRVFKINVMLVGMVPNSGHPQRNSILCFKGSGIVRINLICFAL